MHLKRVIFKKLNFSPKKTESKNMLFFRKTLYVHFVTMQRASFWNLLEITAFKPIIPILRENKICTYFIQQIWFHFFHKNKSLKKNYRYSYNVRYTVQVIHFSLRFPFQIHFRWARWKGQNHSILMFSKSSWLQVRFLENWNTRTGTVFCAKKFRAKFRTMMAFR